MTGLALSMMYMVMTFFNKSVVESVFRSSLEQAGISYSKHLTAPVILNNFLWHGVATVDSGHFVTHYSLFDRGRTAELRFVPANEELLGEFSNDKKVGKLKWFSQGYYCITRTDEGVWFNDMRFGQVKGWEDPDGMYAFSFNLKHDADNSTVVQRGRIEGSKREALRSLWRRIKGN
jgi:inner membrane protein